MLIKTASTLAAIAICGLTIASSALAQTTTTTDPETLRLQQETALLNAQTARFNAEKAAIEARSAAALAEANSIPSNNFGAITATGSAGLAESTILNVEAVHDAAGRIAGTIPDTATRVLVLTDTQRPDLGVFRLYEARRSLVEEAYGSASAEMGSLEGRLRRARNGQPDPAASGAMSAGLVTLAGNLSLIARLGGMFQRDITVGGATITGDDRLLAIAVASALRRRTNAPRVYLSNDWMGEDMHRPLVTQLNALDGLRRTAATQLQEAENLLATYKRAAERATGAAKDAYQACVRELEATKTRINSALTAHENLSTWMATAPSNEVAPFNTIVQQMALDQILSEPGSVVVVVHVHSASQGTMTERSLWTWFGGTPFSVAASSVVTAQQISSSSGEVTAARTYACDSGYTRMGRIHREDREALSRCREMGA